MKSIEEYKKILWEKYKQINDPEIEERYQHSVGVSKKAIELIDFFNLNVDKYKAEVAAILHDYAKFEPYEKYCDVVEEFHLDKKILNINKKILHSILGPYIIQKELGIDDMEILDAVRYHATGDLNMSLLAEVIFLADYTEESRNHPYFEEAIRLSKINFRQAILAKITKKLEHLPNDQLTKDLYNKYKED